MIESGMLEWLIDHLKQFLSQNADNISTYGLEYSTALFMNLCLHRSGKLRCLPMAQKVLSTFLQLLSSANKRKVSFSTQCIAIMGCTKTRISDFSVSFNFSFIGEKWGMRNKKLIFFIFCLCFAKFLMLFQSSKISSAQNWQKMKKSLVQKFLPAKN